ncbi:MAG: glycosyltransferase family 2 protein [Candidatus Pacearchaeota archaeon]|jgi:hypothetical protein
MKKKNQPLVCIVIVNWNGGEKINNCLKSLKKTKYPNYKVVVLDNGSSDDSIKTIKKFKEVFLLKGKENLGFTGGSNLLYQFVIKRFNPDYVCNMNNDIVTVQQDWLSLMVKELEKEEKRGICGNKLVFPDGRVQQLFWDRQPKEYNEKDNGQYNFVREVSAVGGANILIKRSVLEIIGGTDENYFYGPDDIDYCFRAKEKGFKIVYTGLSKSVHVGSFSYKSSSKDFIYKHQSYGMILFSFRHEKFPKAMKMVFNQFVRIFLTRKDPFRSKEISNFYFHKTVIIRTFYFFNSLVLAIKNYQNVKIGDYSYLENETV